MQFTHEQMPKWYAFRAERVFFTACAALIALIIIADLSGLVIYGLTAAAGMSN